MRASRQKIGSHRDQIDVLIALNQETVEKHTYRLKESSFVIYDADKVKADGIKQKSCSIPVTQILKGDGSPAGYEE